jgi:hypothetical protein
MTMLDSGVLRAPLLDHRGLDLDAARRVTYVLSDVAPASGTYTGTSPGRLITDRRVGVLAVA